MHIDVKIAPHEICNFLFAHAFNATVLRFMSFVLVYPIMLISAIVAKIELLTLNNILSKNHVISR